MKPAMIVQVQRSFKDVAPIADAIGTTFYDRLFEVHPDLRPLFPDDIPAQAKKLVQTLAMIVNSLHRLDAIHPEIEALACRHKDYGVVDDHYTMVGEALIWTLEHHLGKAFTPQIKLAWQTAYNVLADLMIYAANQPTLRLRLRR